MLLSLKIDLHWADRQTWRTLFKISDAWLEQRYKSDENSKHIPDENEMLVLFESAEKGVCDVTEGYQEWLQELN